MEELLSIFSKYELKARVFPAFLVLLPIAITVLIWYPELISMSGSFYLILFIVAILFFLAKICRERGKKVQTKLLKEWGNFPSTRMLRHSDNSIDPVTKKRYHIYLQNNVPGIEMPTAEQELEKPDYYEYQYNSAIKWLIENTRDNDHLLQDNINYGFSRNLLGIKFLGIICCVIAILINIFAAYQSHSLNLLAIPLKIWLSILMNCLFLLLWIFYVNKDYVKSSSEAYARTLLSNCENNSQDAS
ncbi:hypothetical protein H9I32_09910 [Bacillus sp. Xin]|uniref:hypothetical protein n=1 Tax=unclassified Bacillus (in: firmicutes) TaxID=185979 RepID=UPI0015716367|nr:MULTISPECIES: hypothetical protein [unclassified Bacillus (in: firmicutes)]MBC6972694.1 hypothetical protein [Bacillus sp. Xin]NSW38838.1 hypothetical protein [Bacillus sp. Xin1]